MISFTKLRSQRGFTLIELMIAIAIVALLVALAVPAYRDYTIRAKVAECINNAAVAKISVSEYRQTLGAWPTSLSMAGLDSIGDTQYCSRVTDYQPSNGAFTIDVNEAAVDPSLAEELAPVMTPSPVVTHAILWDCSRGTTSEEYVKYLPATCRDT